MELRKQMKQTNTRALIKIAGLNKLDTTNVEAMRAMTINKHTVHEKSTNDCSSQGLEKVFTPEFVP